MHTEYKPLNTDDEKDLQEQVRTLFSGQPLAVLSTQEQGQPYSNLIAFAATKDLKQLIFATPRETRKYANLKKDPRVSLLIDNRSGRATDFNEAMAVTSIGTAHEIIDQDRDTSLRLYLNKHPDLKDFVSSPTCALMMVEVDIYFIVKHFQSVMALHIKK